MSVDAVNRVKVWNTFFRLAREQAVSAKKLQDINWSDPGHVFGGGTLDNERIHSLAVIAWCLLALEAREAHLIEELKDQGKLTPAQAKAAHFLGIQEQWALMPKLAGKSGKHNNIRFDKPPHQAIAELASLRNDLFHVNYENLLKKLPTPQKAVSLFNQFVYAMEDMNVILRRHKKRHKRVLSIALDKLNLDTI
ncbi:MAG: hypothetical protein NTZ04_01670 [Chloroflexi bacterium]|nr:hypothetical protein [Chloroflexota bacterium]